MLCNVAFSAAIAPLHSAQALLNLFWTSKSGARPQLAAQVILSGPHLDSWDFLFQVGVMWQFSLFQLPLLVFPSKSKSTIHVLIHTYSFLYGVLITPQRIQCISFGEASIPSPIPHLLRTRCHHLNPLLTCSLHCMLSPHLHLGLSWYITVERNGMLFVEEHQRECDKPWGAGMG